MINLPIADLIAINPAYVERRLETLKAIRAGRIHARTDADASHRFAHDSARYYAYCGAKRRAYAWNAFNRLAAEQAETFPVEQDGAGFYFGDSSRGTVEEGFCTAPIDVKDGDIDAAKRARAWFLDSWCAPRNLRADFV